MPVRLTPAGVGAAGGGTETVIAGLDIVVEPGPVEPTGVVELGGIGTAGRDIVDDAEGGVAGGGDDGVAARIPVADAGDGAAPAAERMPVEESDPVAVAFGGEAAGALCAGAAGAAAAVAGPDDTNVVPHCTQNFAPLWVS